MTYSHRTKCDDGEELSSSTRMAPSIVDAEPQRPKLLLVETTLHSIVEAMALTVEARDPYTAGHQRRVADLALAIANEMAIPEETASVIHLASVIHDIGKIGVPAEILAKPGPLSTVEFGLFRAHPQVGYDILKTIDFPWPIAKIVCQHHERMDGSGYPLGLPGPALLLEARILGVADVVEAMASHRPYRPALGVERALEEISRHSGSLYDPDAVECCLKVFERNAFTWP